MWLNHVHSDMAVNTTWENNDIDEENKTQWIPRVYNQGKRILPIIKVYVQ